ncbi:hypothetical protein [Mobiluncus holmesii]|nr:hypothetical protein [Mobiluncus holmesii]STY89252.1 Uncharacterised protein [Mobiluncus holmesii]
MSNPYQSPPGNPSQVPGFQPSQPMGQPMGQQMPGQPMPGQFARPYEHPQEQTVMVLAIIGIFFWVTSPIAWYLGSKAKKEMLEQNMEPTSRLKVWTLVAMVLTIIGIVSFAISMSMIIVGGMAFMQMANDTNDMSDMSAGLMPLFSAI